MQHEKSSMTDLKRLILAYQKKGTGWDQIVERLSGRIYAYPAQKGAGSEDDAGSFYLYLLPRLKNLLSNYRDKDVPFDHYLQSTLYWNLKSYFRSKKRDAIDCRASAHRSYWETPSAVEGCPVEPIDPPAPADRELFRDPVMKKRLLLLALRCARGLDDEKIAHLSRLAGYDERWLREKVTNLKQSFDRREKRLASLRLRRNRAFYRCGLLEQEMYGEHETDKRAYLSRRIKRCRQIMQQAQWEISRIPLTTTHRAIADELGIPKGTVDTGLRWVGDRLAALYHAARSEYA